MQTPFVQTRTPSATNDRGLRIARLLVAIYFCGCALHGLLRLRLGAPGGAAGVLRLWYVEALLFGAAFGLTALVHGMVRGGGGDRAPRRTKETPRSGMLRVIERDRGR